MTRLLVGDEANSTYADYNLPGQTHSFLSRLPLLGPALTWSPAKVLRKSQPPDMRVMRKGIMHPEIVIDGLTFGWLGKSSKLESNDVDGDFKGVYLTEYSNIGLL